MRTESLKDILLLSRESASTALSPEVEAQNVRRQIVEFASTQLGPDLLNDWNHPRATWPTQADTFVMAFVKLMYMEQTLKRPGDIAAPNSKDKSTSAYGAFHFLSRALGGVLGPAGDVMDSVASAASIVPEKSSLPSTVFEAHLREVQSVAHEVLSTTDYQAYVHAAATGDYATQTSLLFMVDQKVFENQPVVNPYVLWWCDMRGQDGSPGTRPLSDFPEIAPGDERFTIAIWRGFTPTQRWNAVYDALNKWFQRTSAAMGDPTQRIALLASVKTVSEEKRRRGALGPDPAEENRETVAALGPEALTKYNHGTAEDKTTLLKTATLFVEGLNSLLSMLMGASNIEVEGIVVPPVKRP